MKILFITATRIGDAVLSSGLIAHFAKKYPGARFTIVCGAPAGPLFESVPGLERLIIINKLPIHTHWLRLWGMLATTSWDIACDLRGSAITSFLLTRNRIVGAHRDETVHRVIELGRLTNIEPWPPPTLWISDADRKVAKSLMPHDGAVLAIGPTANWGGKQWPPDRFAALALQVTAADGFLPGARIAVLGAASERSMAQPFLREIPSERLIDLIGQRLSIAAACIKHANLYVGNDSGLMHVAAAAGTPTLGLFGPSSEVRYGPWGRHCATVRTPKGFKEIVLADGFDHTSHQSLMEDLSIDTVYTALEKLNSKANNGGEGEPSERPA